MSWPLRALAGCLVLALASGCADPETSSSSSSATSQPSEFPTASATPAPATPGVSPPAAASSGRGCDEEAIYKVMCRFVDAVQADDTGALGEVEREVAGAVGSDLPTSDYTVDECALVGDVTVACEVSFSGRPGVLGFHVVPVNAEYNDGALITPDGEEVRYEVEGYLGRGEQGEFASLP